MSRKISKLKCDEMKTYTVKKRLAVFPSPTGMSLTKLSLAGNKLSDITAGDGKTANLFLTV
jgi:hypothetical protein